MTQNNLYMENDDMRLYIDVQPLLIDELENSKNLAEASAVSAAQSAATAQSQLNNIITYKTNLELYYAQSMNNLSNRYTNAMAELNGLYQQNAASLYDYVEQAKDYAEQAQSTVDNRVSLEHLNQSKALETGEVSDDNNVLVWIKQLARSTYCGDQASNASPLDPKKFVKNGNGLVITKDGIVSGFSSSNYLSRTFSGITFTDKLIIRIKVKTSSSAIPSDQNPVLFELTTENGTIIVYEGNSNNSTQIAFNTRSEQTGTEGGIEYFPTVPYLTYNTEYIIEFIKNAVNKSFKMIVYDVNGNKIDEQTNSVIIAGHQNITAIKIGYGSFWQSVGYIGSIDLKGVNISADGIPVFSGNKTGIDIVKADDYSDIGSPTISADGILQANTGGIIKEGLTFGSINEFECEYTYKASSAHQRPFYLYTSSDGPVQSLTILADGRPASLTTIADKALVEGRTYKFKLVTDFSTYSRIYQDGVLVVNQTTNINPNPYKIVIGSTLSGTNMVQSDYNLNSVRIYVDGNLVYQPCLKIPYTESKTGSKIVNSIYRDRVNDMYNQFGYAPYYTLDEVNDNFTLPMGELYGMIENLRKLIIERTSQ